MQSTATHLVLSLLVGLFCCASALSVRAAATFTPLGDAPGGASFQSSIMALSDDGLVAVGSGFRWTQAGGMVAMPAGAQAVSADGSVIVGSSSRLAFRWTEATGAVSLGDLPGGGVSSTAGAVSADGSIVAGYSSSSAFPSFLGEGFRWTAADSMVGLGGLPGTTDGGIMQGISGDGQVIVGRDNGNGNSTNYRAVKWTAAGGMVPLGEFTQNSRANAASYDGSVIVGYNGQAMRWEGSGFIGLGFLPGMNDSWALDVTADGSVIVGQSSLSPVSVPFIWDATNGMRDLQAVLVSDYGLGAALAGWTLGRTTSTLGLGSIHISADGQTIAGNGSNPLGLREAWIVDLTPVPEPGTLVVAALALLLIIPLLSLVENRKRIAMSRCEITDGPERPNCSHEESVKGPSAGGAPPAKPTWVQGCVASQIASASVTAPYAWMTRFLGSVCLLALPCVMSPVDAGTISKSGVTTGAPNNDDYSGAWASNPNHSGSLSLVGFDADVVYGVLPSGGTTEYAITFGGSFNNAMAVHFILGFGVGANFVRASSVFPALDFDVPLPAQPAVTSEDFSQIVHTPDLIEAYGGTINGTSFQVARFSVDVPDLPQSARGFYRAAELGSVPAGALPFTLRKASGRAVPEPASFILFVGGLLVISAATVRMRNKRRPATRVIKRYTPVVRASPDLLD